MPRLVILCVAAAFAVQVGVSPQQAATAQPKRGSLPVLAIVDYVMPPDGILGGLREASVVVHLEITQSLGTRLRNNESWMVTEHRAKVLAVVKADRGDIVVGKEILFDQDAAGEWLENGQRSVGIETPYRPGLGFVAFLKRNPDSTLAEYRGMSYMWPASKGFVIIETPTAAMPAGLRSRMPVEECLAVLRKLVRDESLLDQSASGAIAGRVTESGGGVLPGVTIRVTGEGRRYDAETRASGTYRIDGVPPGTYRIQADLSGFVTGVLAAVVVDSGKVADGNVTLHLIPHPHPDPLPRLRAHVEARTGARAIDCGQHLVRRTGRNSVALADAETLRKSVDCGLAASRQRKAFWTFEQLQGIDSWIAEGIFGKDGAIFLFFYDDDPSGGSGAPDRFTVERCVTPRVVTDRDGPRFRCKVP